MFVSIFFCFQLFFSLFTLSFPATSCRVNKNLVRKWFMQDTFSFFGVYVSVFYHRLFLKLFQLFRFIFLYCFSFVYCIQSIKIVYNNIFEPFFLCFIYGLLCFYNGFQRQSQKLFFQTSAVKSPVHTAIDLPA